MHFDEKNQHFSSVIKFGINRKLDDNSCQAVLDRPVTEAANRLSKFSPQENKTQPQHFHSHKGSTHSIDRQQVFYLQLEASNSFSYKLNKVLHGAPHHLNCIKTTYYTGLARNNLNRVN